MQEADAERRIQILRGQQTSDAPPRLVEEYRQTGETSHHGGGQRGPERKRRRIAGEDDTERDIRVALEETTAAVRKQETGRKEAKLSRTSNAPLTDARGHINLFPTAAEGASQRNGPKNAEAEAETARKKREFEDQYTMRFANAAGFKQAVGQTPWYHHSGNDHHDGDAVTGKTEPHHPTNIWGNPDPRRVERQTARLAADDPLAAIQCGVRELQDVERERARWREEQRREIRELDDSERAGRRTGTGTGTEREREKQRRRRRKRESQEGDDDKDGGNDDDRGLDGFGLDSSSSRELAGHEHSHSHHRHHRRHRHHISSSHHHHHQQQRSSSSKRRTTKAFPPIPSSSSTRPNPKPN